MPKVPGQKPPSGEGGGAAERLRQFEQARGLRPSESDDEETDDDHASADAAAPESGAQESAADPD